MTNFQNIELTKVKFIGPSSKSILELGNKSNALKLANDFGLPILGDKNSKI